MLQKDLLMPYRTIEDNVSLPLVIRGMRKKEARAKAAPYFAQFGLAGTEKKYPASFLSLRLAMEKSGWVKSMKE